MITLGHVRQRRDDPPPQGGVEAPVLWLSSIRPDGRPHLVAAWFVWDGDALVIFSKPNAQKVRNVRHDPHVTVAIGGRGPGLESELIDGEARLLLSPTPFQRLLLARKYGTWLARLGLTVDRFWATYPQPIRITPSRILDWGGPGWSTRVVGDTGFEPVTSRM